MLRTEHARLLLPIWSAPGAQCVPSQSAANAVTLVATGVPEAYNAYELTPRGVQPLRHQRVAGGLSVTLDEFGLTTQILLAHDPSIVGAVDRRAAQIGRRAAELQRDLAVHKLNTVQALAGQLASRTPRRAVGGVVRCGAKEPANVRRSTRGRRCGRRGPQRPTGRRDRCG